jgi:hypothetical protein
VESSDRLSTVDLGSDEGGNDPLTEQRRGGDSVQTDPGDHAAKAVEPHGNPLSWHDGDVRLPRLIIFATLLAIAAAVPSAAAGDPIPRKPPPSLNELRSDFNGDQRPDLAIAELRMVNGQFSGAVHVLFGSQSGPPTTAGSQYFDHTTPGMPNDDGSPDPHSEINDLGRALASGDFDGDGFDDLAIGSVHDRFRVLYGGPTGLTTARARMIRLADISPEADLPGESVRGENLFGTAFAVGDFNSDGIEDLVVGASRAYNPWVGGVGLFRGTPTGLTPAAAQWVPGNAPGLPSTPETDGFGDVLAAADFNRDGHDDLVVGFGRDHHSSALFAGSVVVLPGAPAGLNIAAAQMFTQNTPGVPDVPESNDLFGQALAAGDLTGDGYPDLAVNAFNEGFSENTPNRGGSITVLRGSPAGLTVSGVQYWTQFSPGVPGGGTPTQFGSSLAFGDFDRDGRGDIAAGNPNETVAGVQFAGSVIVFRGSALGLTVTGIRRLDRTTSGVPPISAGLDFGRVLHTMRQPDGAASLVVGHPAASVSGLLRAGLVLSFRGVPAWFGTPGGITTTGFSSWSAADLPPGAQAVASFGGALA